MEKDIEKRRKSLKLREQMKKELFEDSIKGKVVVITS